MKKLFFLLFLASGNLGAMDGVNLREALLAKLTSLVGNCCGLRKKSFELEAIAAVLKQINDPEGTIFEKTLDKLGMFEEGPALLEVLSKDPEYQNQNRAQSRFEKCHLRLPDFSE